MIYWICVCLVVTPLLVERWLTDRRRRAIPIRIHVHGTRGKSSTVRLLARMLSERGVVVLAKTTGDAPEYILPDGRVEPIRRLGPPRILEHVALLRRAARLRVDAVVVEGMAIGPETVWHSEEILRATHAVVTNTRPDHAETMGEGRRGVLRTLSLMMPQRGAFFTGDEEGAGELLEVAERNECAATVVASPTSTRQPFRLAATVAERIFPANPATGLPDVADDEGPDWRPIDGTDGSVRLLDLFSANDVETSAALWAARPSERGRLRVAVLATRADRPLRTKSFLVRLLVDHGFHRILPLGDHAGWVWLAAGGERVERVAPWKSPAAIVARLVAEATAAGFVGVDFVGLGNCHGAGEKWRALSKRNSEHAD
ncbi:MAG: hypothetical protein GX458_06760 [Phyllobacteriaceae bacterium]|nr:hypothetical protein [Phyllobacteriaceae bacterium]